MSEPRNYIRATTGGFNATTVDTAVYTQLRTVWTTPTSTLVGVFSPLSLGRTAGANAPSVPSFARVMLQGVVAPGDQVRIINSAGVVRFTVPASVESSGWFYLAPDDSIGILSAGATSAEILVLDISEDNLPTLALAEVTQAAGGGGSSSSGIAPQDTQIIAATGTINSFDGDLIVFVSAAAPATLTLPALGTVALGSTITVIRTGGAGLPTIVTSIPADQVNGSATASGKDYPLRSFQDEVRYIRVPSGWARPQGTPAPAVIIDGANPTDLSALSFPEGTAYVEVTNGTLGAFIDLPLLANVRVGSRFTIFNSAIVARTIEGQPGENVNGQAQITLPAGKTAIVESAGGQWYVTVSA